MLKIADLTAPFFFKFTFYQNKLKDCFTSNLFIAVKSNDFPLSLLQIKIILKGSGTVTTSLATRDHSKTAHCANLRLLTGNFVVLTLPHYTNFSSLPFFK